VTTSVHDGASFPAGSLVRARDREWVVLPGGDDEFLILRPLGGGEDDIAGVFAEEGVEAATFDLPTPEDLGDDRSARLLRDALRIGFRSSGGPFRSLAALAVDPRPYQLVPLLVALRQEPVRLLIADDVGIGKTIEAGLIAAELLAQGSAERLAVLCPPSLAEQWQDELRTKFGLEPELVLPGTVRRLERGLEYGQSIFERHPVTIVSADFIKSDMRRDDFLRAAPELVIVDEAHTCVSDDTGSGGRGRTQRYRLIKDLARGRGRHLILVTATPHSGNEGAFRNLIALLNPALQDADLSTEEGRRQIAAHLVQRRRADIRDYLGSGTKFPSDRQTDERTYELAPAYRALFDDVLAYARGQVTDSSGTRLQQRIRWWSALSLLRALASSPAAAAATLATRAATLGAGSTAAVDAIGAAAVLDLAEDESLDVADAVPGAVTSEEQTPPRGERGLLRDFRDRALAIAPDEDTKLKLAEATVQRLLKDGFHPIVFCRFIPTAGYVAAHLRDRLPKTLVEVVTGELPPEERAERVRGLAEAAGSAAKVLVATDCLSEGVNLQEDFQAVVHYDLAWNPTRHEQREGRVDRFGQPREIVRAVTLYGADNGIDGIVMDVLIRKHDAIRRDLGVSVPVPATSDAVLGAIMEGVMLRGRPAQQMLDFELPGEARRLEFDWESSAEAEKRSRTRYAHHTIHPDEVQREVDAYRMALGSPDDVAGFVRTALEDSGAIVTPQPFGFAVKPDGLPVGLDDALGRPGKAVRFYRDLPAPRGAATLIRSSPVTAAIARHVLDAALDPALDPRARPARRCGVIATSTVRVPTVALLIRMRVHLTLPGRAGPRGQVAEEARIVAFTGTPANPAWLDPGAVEALLAERPDRNVPADIARNIMRGVLAALPGAIAPHLEQFAQDLAASLREAHVRVRTAARGERAGDLAVRGLTVRPQLPVDVLGVYFYQPGGSR
jgi:superfamily II DNA or RNA helicase